MPNGKSLVRQLFGSKRETASRSAHQDHKAPKDHEADYSLVVLVSFVIFVPMSKRLP